MPRALGLAALLVLAACPAAPDGGPSDAGSDAGPANRAPTVRLEGASTVLVGDAVTLTAVGEDPDGDALAYRWSVEARPEAGTLDLSDAAGPTVELAPDAEGTWTVAVVASDGALDSAPATLTVTADKPPFLAGSLAVTVVDASGGAPIPGAEVAVAGLAGTTDAEGTVVLEDPALTGPQPVTVTGPGSVKVDHDLDPTTPEIDRPLWRGATLQGVDRAELVVPLRPTPAPPTARGRLRGTVDWDLFDRLPAVDPVITLDPADPASEAFRAVLVGPLPRGPLSELDVGDLLGAPVVPASQLPGNLTSDDPFLDAMSGMLGLTGPDALTRFVVDAPAGHGTFFVLGALVRVDTATLVPLLTGSGVSDPGAILGSMELTTLFVGTFEADVPAGGEQVLDAPLTPDDLDLLFEVPLDGAPEVVEETGPWALDPTVEAHYRRVRVSPTVAAEALTPSSLDDPRLAADLPDSTPVEILQADGRSYDPKQWAWLAVPEDTGVPATDVPYGLAVAAAPLPADRFPGDRLLPLGLVFTRVGELERPARFALPDLSDLGAPPPSALLIEARGLWPQGADRAYALLPGVSAVTVPLNPDAPTPAAAPLPFPTLDAPVDAGLDVYLVVDRPDPTTTEVASARAYCGGFEDPSTGAQTLGDALPLSLGADADLAHVVLSARTRITVDVGGQATDAALEVPLWDVYGTADATALPRPGPGAPFAAGDEVRVDLRTERFPAPLDMAHFSGDRLRRGPSAHASDAWLTYWP